MLPVHGFYGHVQRNDLLSVAMFAGFLLALQLLAAVVLFLPLMIYDLEHVPIYNFAGYTKRYASLICAIGAGLFLIQFFLHVRLVRVRADFCYVNRITDPRLCNIVETLAIGAGLPCPKVGLIDTDARNAFACGINQSSAVVVATRGLVDALDDDELSAVMAHEIAHIRNGDIQLMAAANVMLGNLLYLQQYSILRIVDWRQIVLVVILPPFMLLFLIGAFLSGLALLIARVSRLMISSSRELIADAEAVRMTHNPSALISALAPDRRPQHGPRHRSRSRCDDDRWRNGGRAGDASDDLGADRHPDPVLLRHGACAGRAQGFADIRPATERSAGRVWPPRGHCGSAHTAAQSDQPRHGQFQTQHLRPDAGARRLAAGRDCSRGDLASERLQEREGDHVALQPRRDQGLCRADAEERGRVQGNLISSPPHKRL